VTPRLGKNQRQYRVANLLEQHSVTSQAQLIELLADEGCVVNQATISRDLEELGAVKVRVPGGESVYAIAEFPSQRSVTADHLRRVLGEWVVEVARSGDLLVMRTPPGSAHVVGSAVDRSDMIDILGTVAGDDTILVVAVEGAGPALESRLCELAGL
jgi:transcriptional regulator of arginine metabolism